MIHPYQLVIRVVFLKASALQRSPVTINVALTASSGLQVLREWLSRFVARLTDCDSSMCIPPPSTLMIDSTLCYVLGWQIHRLYVFKLT